MYISRLIQESGSGCGHLEELLKTLCALFDLAAGRSAADTADFLKNESLEIREAINKKKVTFLWTLSVPPLAPPGSTDA